MIQLRKLEPTDLPFLYQWENDPSSWKDASTHNPLSHADLRAYISSTTGDIYKDGQLRLIVEQDGVAVGCADLFDLDPLNRRAAIGLYVAPFARGKGVAKEVMLQLEQYAFVQLSLRLIYAVVAVDNVACSRLFESIHYTSSSPLIGWTLHSDAIIWQKMNNFA